MPKQLNYQLNETELQQVEQAIITASEPLIRLRAIAIRLLHLGKKPEEVAELLSVSTGTVYNWHGRWRKNGLDGLNYAPRSGRPKLVDENYVARLGEVSETDPAALGYGFTIWTIDRLREHMTKITGIQMSNETFLSALDRVVEQNIAQDFAEAEKMANKGRIGLDVARQIAEQVSDQDGERIRQSFAYPTTASISPTRDVGDDEV